MTSDRKINLYKRKSRPQTLGGAFGGLLRIFGRTASDSDLAANWDRILGPELSAQAKMVGISRIKGKGQRARSKEEISGRTLAIRAMVPAMATSLAYRAQEIRDKVNKYFGYDAVAKIRISK